MHCASFRPCEVDNRLCLINLSMNTPPDIVTMVISTSGNAAVNPIWERNHNECIQCPQRDEPNVPFACYKKIASSIVYWRANQQHCNTERSPPCPSTVICDFRRNNNMHIFLPSALQWVKVKYFSNFQFHVHVISTKIKLQYYIVFVCVWQPDSTIFLHVTICVMPVLKKKRKTLIFPPEN